jgi:Glycosyltransferase family 87
MNFLELVRRWGPWLALLAGAVAYYPRFIKDPNGMTQYPRAAECMWMHEILQNCAEGAEYFTYPPAFGFLMMPFVPMPLGLRNLVWYAITLAAMIVSFWLCDYLVRRLYPGPWTRRELVWMRVLSLLLIAKFVLAVLENQAYDALPLLLLMGGIFWLATERPLAGAASLGVAAAIKATPLLFLPYLLLKRRFLAAACFVAVFLFVSILPDLFFAPQGAEHGYLVTWVREIASPALRNDEAAAPLRFWAGDHLLNHSLRGGVARMIDGHANPQWFKVALYGTWLVFIGVLAVLLAKSPAKSPKRCEFVAVDGALLFIGMLMLSPMTSRSHYVLLLLPYYVLVAAVIRDASMRRLGIPVLVASYYHVLVATVIRDASVHRLGIPVLVASFVLLTVTSNDVVGSRVTEWAYRTGHPEIGTLLLMVGVAAIVLRRACDRMNRIWTATA